MPASSKADRASTLWLLPPTVQQILVRQGWAFCALITRDRQPGIIAQNHEKPSLSATATSSKDMKAQQRRVPLWIDSRGILRTRGWKPSGWAPPEAGGLPEKRGVGQMTAHAITSSEKCTLSFNHVLFNSKRTAPGQAQPKSPRKHATYIVRGHGHSGELHLGYRTGHLDTSTQITAGEGDNSRSISGSQVLVNNVCKNVQNFT